MTQLKKKKNKEKNIYSSIPEHTLTIFTAVNVLKIKLAKFIRFLVLTCFNIY